MILQRIKYFFTKNPLDLLNYEDFLSDRIRCEDEIKTLLDRITAIEKQIDIYWDKAHETKSRAEERAWAERINTESQKRDFLLQKLSGAETTLRTIEDYINKIEEKNKIWATAPLTKGSQLELEEMLIKIEQYEKLKQQQEVTLTTGFEPKTDTIDDNVNEILQNIRATKQPDTYKITSDKEPLSTQQKDLEPDS
jgi:hypothetical protein